MSYVSKRFRTFRKPIRRKYANGGVIRNPGQFLVGDREVFITVNSTPNVADLVAALAKYSGPR